MTTNIGYDDAAGVNRPGKVMRTFETGATRSSEEEKLDYEGFLSPLVLRRYAQYMHEHRTQAGGKLRDSDNWQKGIPLTAYMKSLWRHFMSLWLMHRHDVPPSTKEDALCAIIFNASGYLHELLRGDLGVNGGTGASSLADASILPGRPAAGADGEPHDPTPSETNVFGSK